MQFVIGLGNPGSEYARTRHNIGFMVVDQLATDLGTTFSAFKKGSAEVAKIGDIFLVKPQTFMNASGQAVQAVINYYSQEDADIFIIYDDLDIQLGSYKFQFGTGPKIHNGVNSVTEHLGSSDFWHVRIGIDGRSGDRSIPGKDYVLQPFQPSEQQLVAQVLQEVGAELRSRVA